MTLLNFGGCASLKLPSLEDNPVTADAKNPVAKVVCIWQRAEGRGLDELPTRGFAGQIVFLTANSPTPVEVDGNVTIYLFDDQGTLEDRSRPLHVFRFVDGSWRAHLKPTAWGPTYQLFIPYVRKGNHRAACSLVVQFDPPESRRVTSDMANIVLTGTDRARNIRPPSYQLQHRRIPASRLPAGRASGNISQAVPASGQLPEPSTPANPQTPNNQVPKFESFSIPYDLRRVDAR